MLPNVLPVEASHSSLDIFERAPLLITFDSSFGQRIGPLYAPNGPTLEFVVTGDRTNFIDLQNIYLEVKCNIKRGSGNALRYDATSAANTDSPIFVNNALHSLFSDCNIVANEVRISSANGYYAPKAFLETEFSTNKESKDTWLKSQGYNYEEDPCDFTTAAFTSREQETRTSNTITLIGKIAADFFTCDKHLLSGVTLRLTFLRTRPEFCVIYDDDAKDYKVEITQANLHVRKMTVSENVYTAIETALTKTNAMYRYTEIIPKSFLMPQNSNSWNQENIFNGEPIRRFAIAMTSNRAFLGGKTLNPFHFQKFNLATITVYRNGYPVAGTPLQTDDDKKLYLNSLEALAFGHHGHGIPFSKFTDHYFMVFDMTSTQQASHDYLYPELTNASISVELRFTAGLAANTEIFFLGERSSVIYINSQKKVSKNRPIETGIETKK